MAGTGRQRPMTAREWVALCGDRNRALPPEAVVQAYGTDVPPGPRPVDRALLPLLLRASVTPVPSQPDVLEGVAWLCRVLAAMARAVATYRGTGRRRW
jgi:hypothetical protein